MTVTYDSTTHALTFSSTVIFDLITGINSPAQVLGFLPNETINSVVSGPNFVITGGNIDLTGPTSLILSLSGDERDEIKNDLYMTGLEEKPMHYFGRIITDRLTDFTTALLLPTSRFSALSFLSGYISSF
jgi:hypothetical protein